MTSIVAEQKKVWTEDELAALPDNGYNYELVDGELVMSPKNKFEHEFIVQRMMAAMLTHNSGKRLGVVLGSNLGCWMSNRNVRAPDISFISFARIAEFEFKPKTRAFFPAAPDLAIEVVSEGNTRSEMTARLRDFFSSGCRLAWIVDPFEEYVEVCRSPLDRTIIGAGGSLDGGDVFAGFAYPINDLFEADWS